MAVKRIRFPADYEDEYIRTNYRQDGPEAVGAHLNRSRGWTVNRAGKLGLTRRHKLRRLTTEEKTIIKHLGWFGGYTVTKLAKLLKRGKPIVSEYLYKLKWPKTYATRRKQASAPRSTTDQKTVARFGRSDLWMFSEKVKTGTKQK